MKFIYLYRLTKNCITHKKCFTLNWGGVICLALFSSCKKEKEPTLDANETMPEKFKKLTLHRVLLSLKILLEGPQVITTNFAREVLLPAT